jgi:hypothetical protein
MLVRLFVVVITAAAVLTPAAISSAYVVLG